MAKQKRAVDTVAHLRNLPAGSPEYIECALRLVETATQPEALQEALDALAESDDPRLRPALLARYTSLAANGLRRDPGCFQRAALLRALRPLARKDDAALLEEAVRTTEFMPPFAPPNRGDVAAGLRSVALVALNEVDETLAGYHAVRLLVDQYTSPMSGEPAVTAARVLAAQGHVLPLYAYLLAPLPGGAEVVAECLRGLGEMPASLLRPLLDRFAGSDDEIVLLGLFDLLLARDDSAAFADVVLDFVRTTRQYNVYRYVVSVIVARRRKDLIAELAALAGDESDRVKAEILREALALR